MAAVVFDLDGTLIDSAPDIQVAASAVLDADGFDPLSLEETRHFIGKGAENFVTQMCNARGVPNAMRQYALSRFLQTYEGAVEHTVIYPGVKQALRSLKSSGHMLGICTNKPMAPCKAVLAHLEMDGFFEVIVAGDSLAKRKPDPAPLELAVSLLGQPQAYFVGDSEVDGQTAANAGLPFFLFSEGYRKLPSHEITHRSAFSHFDALPALLTGSLRDDTSTQVEQCHEV